MRASRLISGNARSVLFVASRLQAREIKIASALRRIGWKVILIHLRAPPVDLSRYFDGVIRAQNEAQAHAYAKALGPTICHVFSSAVDAMMYRFCADKPGPVVIDMKDVFCSALFAHGPERFEPTRECLEKADALCARDLQASSAKKLEGFRLPRHTLLFPEYGSLSAPTSDAPPRADAEQVSVVLVSAFTPDTPAGIDGALEHLARTLSEQRIHLHIYPDWSYHRNNGSDLGADVKKTDFFRLQVQTDYVHMHDSLSSDELARALPAYDFGIVAEGAGFGEPSAGIRPEHIRTSYCESIAYYLDARLPVLVSRQAGFNRWILNRYGLAVDLEGISQPGFREHLLAMKRDPALRARAQDAAGRLSIERNVSRLDAFYGRIIDEGDRHRLRLGFAWSVAGRLPLLGSRFRRLESEIQRLNQTNANLRSALEAEKRRCSQTPRRQLTQEPQHGRRNLVDARARLEVERGSQWAEELSGLLNWPGIRNPVEQANGMPELLEMIRLFAVGSASLNQLSSCWQVLGFKNFNQLLSDGYRNFKRTIGCNYFNFLVQSGDPQIAFLESHLDSAVRKNCWQAAVNLPDDLHFDWHDQKSYRYFVLMLWSYAKSVDTKRCLDRLEEPEEGNPLVVPCDGQRASQDLANSLLEYYAMAEAVTFDSCRRVLEIGGGYGRDAYVILQLNPQIQYTLVDIPPALWVAQRYLSSVLPKRTVFRVRDFQRYEEVREEMEQASVVCLLPHQLELLPDRRFDLSLNISSFGEMQPDQIRTYLEELERLTNGHFYMKQWKVSQNAFDHLALTEEDYPVSRNWSRVYSRTCRVQESFFEALYQAKGHVP